MARYIFNLKLDSSDPSAWPFPAVTDARKAGEDSWREISAELADEFLNVLPPIYFAGGFMVGEAADHAWDGMPIYAAVVEAPRDSGRFWMREVQRCDAIREARLLRERLLMEPTQ